MVATRRSRASAIPASSTPSKPTKRKRITMNAIVDMDTPLMAQPHISRVPSLSTTNTVLSKPSSELGSLTLTSPFTGRTPGKRLTTNHTHILYEQAGPSTAQVAVAIQQLVMPGSLHNPILVAEDSPPRKARLMKRQKPIEPHKFQDRHNMLYTANPPRPALAPKLVGGNTFTGHESQDMYRMRTAKTVQPIWRPIRAQRIEKGLPFERQCPMSAQHLATQMDIGYPQTRPGPQYYAQPRLCPQNETPLPMSEEELRTKAAQYIRECSRLSPRTGSRVADSDKTDKSEPERVNEDLPFLTRKSHLTKTFSGSTRSKQSRVTVLSDSHLRLTPPIEHTWLLASLLQAYPQSADQNGLREDISMLVFVNNKHMADWLDFEAEQSQRLEISHNPRWSRSTTFPTQPFTPCFTSKELAEMEIKKRQDDEIRSLLSANADLWQDGSGLSVADVYAGTRASTPAASQDEGEVFTETSALVVTSPQVRCDVKTLSSPAATPDTRRLVTALPKATMAVSLPAVRSSGRKRIAPVLFRIK